MAHAVTQPQPCTDRGSRVYLWYLLGAAAEKTYFRPHIRLSERPAEPPLLWSLCAGGNSGPGRLARTPTSPDAQRSRRHCSSSTAPCSRLPACEPGKSALKLPLPLESSFLPPSFPCWTEATGLCLVCSKDLTAAANTPGVL